MATAITVANENNENGNAGQESGTKHKKLFRTKDESKQNGQNIFLNWFPKTMVIPDTQLMTAATNKKKASAYPSVPYQKKDTENIKQFQKYFKKTYKTAYFNEASEQPDHMTSSGSEDEQS